MHECALFRQFPGLIGRIPWIGLAQTPTPVEPLVLEPNPRTQGFPTDLWIKRDDLSAQPYGGNKVRKLEFLLAAAQERGARRLITVGAAGSHHALATTIYGRALGFDVTLILFPQPFTPHVREILLLDQAYGAELRYARRMETVPATLFATTLRYRNQRSFVIAPGGSDATGTLGYVSAALELAEQVASGKIPEPKSLVVAAGTLGTAAGLALGFAIARMSTKIQAVRITSRLVANERVLARLIRGAEVLLRRAGAELAVADRAIRQVVLRHEYIGHGYGRETAAGRQATLTFAERGIHLDPTYTAKAAAAFINEMNHAEKPALFWQTLSAVEPHTMLQGAAEEALPKPFRDYVRGP